MQRPYLKLNEIIWEITSECKNNCTYCGSKFSTGMATPSGDEIIKTAKAIAAYPPNEIDISGGDPLLIPHAVHQEVIQILKAANPDMKIKIIVNPKSFSSLEMKKILAEYDWIGVSINTPAELDIYSKTGAVRILDHTIITNFNLKNIFMFDDIEMILKTSTKIPWQIQYTIYNDERRYDFSVYDNTGAFNYLSEKINNSTVFSRIILADNMNSGQCGAGKSSIGILSSGEVIPCLSMRSWVPDVMLRSEGNIIDTPLKQIWETGFHNFRFGEYKCCKDVCNNRFIDCTKTIKRMLDPNYNNKGIRVYPTIPIDRDQLFPMYGARIPQVMAYAVSPHVMAYAVTPGIPGGTTVYSVGGISSTPVYSTSVITTETTKTDWDFTVSDPDHPDYNPNL